MDSAGTCPLTAFDTLLNRNVPHILENIFSSLDYNSFKTCMKVNKTWREVLTTAPYQKILDKLLNEKWENEEKLYFASRDGNTEELRKLISNLKVDVNFVTKYHHSTPLITAVHGRHKEVVKLLLDAGAEVNKAHGDQFPLLEAARQGDEDIVLMLLDAGAGTDINKHYSTGRTPLWWTAHRGHLKLAKILIEQGADPNKADCNECTPLYVAASWGYTKVVQVLLEGGANPNLSDRYGVTPLLCCIRLAYGGHQSVVKLLLEGGSDPNKENIWGTTPLVVAAWYGRKEAVKKLMEGGADPDKADRNGRTPLEGAKVNGHNEVVKVLLDGGAKH